MMRDSSRRLQEMVRGYSALI